jgi:hypothetical protein
LGIGDRAATVSGTGDDQEMFVGPEPDTDLVAGAHGLGGLGTLAVHVHLATIHGVRGE